MTALTKAKVAQIDAEIQAALSLIGQTHGVKFQLKKFRYAEAVGLASIGIEMSSISDDTGEAVTKEMLALQNMLKYKSFGKLTSETANKTFVINGKFYAVVGYESRCYANPFVVKDIATGKTFKTNEQMIKTAGILVAA